MAKMTKKCSKGTRVFTQLSDLKEVLHFTNSKQEQQESRYMEFAVKKMQK